MDSPAPQPQAGDITALLQRMKADERAASELVALVYGELRRIAASYMRSERSTHTLQPTALIHEAWMRMADQTRVDWRDRAHFFGVAASMMRRVLVDHARQRLAGKRGAGQAVLSIEWIEVADEPHKLEEMLAIHEALGRLEAIDAQQARIVEMHYFAGMSVEETAAALDISTRTVDREWSMARAWLRGQMSAANTAGGRP
jgi:RNA polymerase sigma-70 factor (ECF subfamily)